MSGMIYYATFVIEMEKSSAANIGFLLDENSINAAIQSSPTHFFGTHIGKFATVTRREYLFVGSL